MQGDYGMKTQKTDLRQACVPDACTSLNSMRCSVFFFLVLLCLSVQTHALATEAAAEDCSKYKGEARFETCENARKYGLSLNAAALVEWLAERTYAYRLCGVRPDPSEERHKEALLAGSLSFRALFEAELRRLEERCIYDPRGWCQERGLSRP